MITSIEYLETTIPQGGSGTGYSEPDKFKVTFDDGSTDVMSVDIWYLPKDRIAYALVDALREIGVIAAGELWNDVFRMYLHALPKNRRPGFWDELIAQMDGEVEQPEPKAYKPQFNLPPELQGKKFRIRKLTPRECFRLMGVDDEDIDKIQAAGISNSSQYKLAGNSIVVDNLFHIFRKMFIERGPDAQWGGQMSIFSSMDDGEEVYYTKGNPLRVVTLCSGYDSQCLALERLKREYPAFDYELIAWSEFDPESKRPLNQQPAVIAHNALFPQWADRNLGDMTKIDWTKVPDFDLLFYSTPCTDVSAAGLQRGFTEGSRTRSSIIWNVRDAILIKHPKYACLENVKAMVSKKFLPMFNLWQEELMNQGYTNHPQVMNAKDYGVPQNRERIFLVSILGENQPYNFPAKMPLELRLKDVLQPPEEVDEKYYLSDKMLEYFQRVDDDKSHGHNFNPSDGGGQCLRDKDGTRPAGGRQLCQGRVNSSQDGVVVSPEGISPCHSAGHGNQPKVIE